MSVRAGTKTKVRITILDDKQKGIADQKYQIIWNLVFIDYSPILTKSIISCECQIMAQVIKAVFLSHNQSLLIFSRITTK